MELKTQVVAENDKQEIFIHRKFDLPVESLFQAYTEPKYIEQWMGNKVLKMDNQNHGAYQFETKDRDGNVLFRANGVIHEVVANQKIIRTFEMENAGFPAQLEFIEFTKLSNQESELKIHIIFKSITDRDKLMKLPFSQGINMAHNHLQKIMTNR